MRHLFFIATMLFAVGCTCNDGGNPAGRGRKAKAGKFKRGKHKMKGKTRRGAKANIPKVTVGVYFLDSNKLTAGDEDPWVKVEREVGAKTPAKNAVWQMFKGPNDEEMAQGLTLQKSGSAGFMNFNVTEGVATLQLREGCSAEGGTITVFDHLTKTLKAFPDIKAVKLLDPEGKTQDLEGEGDSRPACLEP